jgi:hypothetical protein
MDLRTQIGIVGTVAILWGAAQWVRVRPVLDHATEAERMSLGTLEQRVAQQPKDVIATRVLLRRYLDLGMPRVVTDAVRRAPEEVRRDGVVSLLSSRAEEALGHIATANAIVMGALGRCSAVPTALAEGQGCDVRTQTELAIESTALDRMTQWNITPISDPSRASLAHELATRPVRLAVP